jgi:hypothetical protein
VANANNGRNGVLTLYRAGAFTIQVTQQGGPESGFSSGANGSLSVVVSPSPNQTFAWALQSPQTNGVAFVGANTLTAQDIYSNTVTNYNAAANPVTITAGNGLNGVVSFSGHAGNVLNLAGDFSGGVANLTGLGMTYLGSSGSGRFTAVAGPRTGVSGVVTIQPGAPAALQVQAVHPVTTSAIIVQAGQRVSLTLAIEDQSGNVVTAYDNDATVTFSGVPVAAGDPPDPTVTNSAGVARTFGTTTTLTFVDGRSRVTAGTNNGVMRIFQPTSGSPYLVTASADLAPSGTINTPSGNELFVTVNPGVANHVRISGPTNATTGVITQFTIQTRDAFSNVTTVAATTQIRVSSTPTGTFFANQTGAPLTPPNTYSILAGASSANIFFRPNVTGTHTLNGTAVAPAMLPVMSWTVTVADSAQASVGGSQRSYLPVLPGRTPVPAPAGPPPPSPAGGKYLYLPLAP